jgi:hypothetical protein
MQHAAMDGDINIPNGNPLMFPLVQTIDPHYYYCYSETLFNCLLKHPKVDLIGNFRNIKDSLLYQMLKTRDQPLIQAFLKDERFSIDQVI